MSKPTVISIENMSKYYRLGLIGGGTLREDLNRWWAMARGKPDPLLKIGDVDHGNRKGGMIWALRDINLEVKEGEILGVIGRNGAGKSTLLKILSRITAPTEGRAVIRGRVGSLLEVGTGFHPELTGRENIYLNGTILGMSRAEVRGKLEEIVEFAEMAQFIDTPVKRYSSGMIVRLAFAVAAHLEPEILIVDEVLAVGDARFQKKCLGKMKDVSSHGRTVLFVSHNMSSIRSLCTRAVLLDGGRVRATGNTDQIIGKYSDNVQDEDLVREWSLFDDAPGDDKVKLASVEIRPKSDADRILVTTPVDLVFKVWCKHRAENTNLSLVVSTVENVVVFNTTSEKATFEPGTTEVTCEIPGDFLNDEYYFLQLLVVQEGRVLFNESAVHSFKVEDTPRAGPWHGKWAGVVRPQLNWKIRMGSDH